MTKGECFNKWWLKLGQIGQKSLMKLALGYKHYLYSKLAPSYNLQIILDKKSC